MALVVFLRGVNVGGHRTFRPSLLARQLKHLDVVNIGAAGTFVIRRRVPRAQVRREFARRLPFDTQIVICRGREIVNLVSRNFFPGRPVRADVVRFLRKPPFPGLMGLSYRVLFAAAVATIPRRYRKMLGVRRWPLPVLALTRLVLRVAERALGSGPRAQDMARVRLRRLERETPEAA